MWISRSVVVFAGVLIAAAFGRPPEPSALHSLAGERMQTKQADTPPSETAAIAKIRDEWAKNLHTKQLEPLVNLYATQAAFLTPTGERIVGQDAIRELCRKTMTIMTSDIALRSAVTDQSGSLAYDSGEFSETLVSVADGSKSESHGSYLMVFKRQADGQWLIVEQVWRGIVPPRLEHKSH
jgi:uncharacterized protein (TIGR02246 family)